MRRFLLVIVLAALMAFSAQVVLAAPSVSGLYYQTVKFFPGEDAPYQFAADYFFRLNVSGDVSENLSYYARLQGNQTEEFKLSRANVTYKNVATSGLSLTLGREYVGWTRTNNFGGFDDVVIDGVVLKYSSEPFGLDAYYQVNSPTTAKEVFSDEKIAARVTYATQVSGLDVEAAAKFDRELKENAEGFGYGFSASVGMADFGSAYVELGKNAGEEADDELDYIVVGANIDVLKPATGIGAWVEYDVTNEHYAFQLSREIVDGLTLYFGGDNDNDDDELKTAVTVEFAISF